MNTRWQLEQIITTWLDAGGPTEEVPVLVPDHTSASDRDARLAHWPFGAVLYELWDDPGRLPAQTSERLGLPHATTYADLARLLWSMREQPWFPARTYREAATCLTSLPPTAIRTLVETVQAVEDTGGSNHGAAGVDAAVPQRASAEARPATTRQRAARPVPSGRVVQPVH